MDGIAHLLWAFALFKVLKIKFKKKINLYAALFFGVFPDLFAFLIPAVLFVLSFIFPGVSIAAIMPYVRMLYNISHSLFTFILVFALVSIIMRKIPLELCFWLLHILIDIPTHSFEFYPTPFVWPFSEYRFDGVSWTNPYFLIANYTALGIVYLLIKIKLKK